MSCKVSFIGLGVMGYPMAGYISKAGHNVTVFNRTKNKAEKWVKTYKGQVSNSPAEAAKDALADFKNPHSTSGAIAVTYNATAATISALEGNTVVSQSTTQVTVSTCIAMDDAKTPACIMKSNLISIE